MRNSVLIVALIGACIFSSGCRFEPKKKPVDVTQTVTVPATRGF
jgi:hypothetical protein